MSLLIAGGGLAGAAVACELARSGVAVTVLERNTGPIDKVCGDFLSVEGQHYLQRLGLDLAALGGAPINRVRVLRGAHVAEAALPFPGLGLSRRVLDEALLRRAADCGAAVQRGVTAAAGAPGISFLATGKHDLRGVGRTLAAPPEDLVGFKMYLRLSAASRQAIAGTVDVLLFADGYAGLQPVDGDRANLCLLVHRDRLAHSDGWAGLLEDLQAGSRLFRERLLGAEMLLERPLSIARVPYGFMHTPREGETMFRLGDQACVVPSFTGDGMAMALHSAALAARTYLGGGSPADYHRRLRADVRGPIMRAGLLYAVGRSRVGQGLLMRALGFWPGMLGRAARATRVPANVWV